MQARGVTDAIQQYNSYHTHTHTHTQRERECRRNIESYIDTAALCTSPRYFRRRQITFLLIRSHWFFVTTCWLSFVV